MKLFYRLFAVWLFIFCAFTASAQAADNTLYGVELVGGGTQRFFSIDQTTGAATVTGVAPTFTSAAMARRASDGLIFYTEYTDGGSTTNGRVATWNPDTNAKATLPTTPGTQFIRLAFNSSDTLYAMNQSNQLYTINTSSGAATLIGTVTGAGLVVNGGGDIAFSASGTFYMTVGSNLYTVSGTTATLLGSTGIPTPPTGLAYGIDGNLYSTVLSGTNSAIYKINPATGAATLMPSSTGAPIGDLASMPKYADMQITKTAGSSSFSVGQNVTYTLSVKNNGPQTPSAPITVTDTLPTGLTYVSATGTGWTCANASGTITCTSSAIPASGATMSPITLTVSVGSAALPSVTNTARVSTTTFDQNAANAASTAVTPVVVSDLQISKSHSGSFVTGSTGTYTLNVSNSGTGATNGTITVTDTLPAGLTVNGGAAGAVASGGTNGGNWTCNSNAASPQVITCTSSTAITASGSSVFNFNVNVGLGTALGTNSVTNAASVAGGGETNTSNNTASDPTTILSPNLTIAKSHAPGTFVRGSNGTYNLTVINSGTASTNGTITVTDTLPTGLTIAAGAVTLSGANAANWNCTASGQIVTCTSSTLIPNSGSNSSTFGFSVGVGFDSPGSVTNNASVSGGGEATANNGNNTAADITPVITTIGCSDVYATGFSGGRNSLYKLVGATMTPIFTAPQIVGGLAISANGSAYYDDGTFANPPLFRFDGTTQTNTGMTLPNLNVGEAADAAGNVFYIDTAYHLRKAVAGGSGAAIDLGAISFETGDAIGPQLRYGDMAIDGEGRLYWYSSIANGAGKTYLYQVSPSNVFPAKSLGNIGPDGATGAAFDANGKLITTNKAGQVFSIDLGSSTFAAVVVGTASPSVYDLGSCVQPSLNPNLAAAKAVANITKAQTPATNASTADVLEYTITITNNGNLPTVDATLADSIPTGTTYVAGSTTLNGATVADASGAMPYATAREISSTGQPAGVITAGNSSVVVKFRVTVNSGSLPVTINNTATITYPKVSGGTNTPQTVTTNTTSTPILSTPPNIGLLKSVTPDGTQMPGTELTYTIAFSNTGGASASNFRLTDPDPSNAMLRLNANTDFKVGSVTNSLGTTGLIATVAYSNDNGITYAYTPVSTGGSAPAGFDRNVTHIRWSFAGSLSPTAPNNAGSVSFVVRIR